jgi:hypothetical protein
MFFSHLRDVKRAQTVPVATSPEYERVQSWLAEHGKSWKWLGAQCDLKQTQMSNWGSRGIPATHYKAIAAAMGQSVDWLCGRADATQQFVSNLSPMALKIAAEFDKIADPSQQIEAFAQIITIIATLRRE